MGGEALASPFVCGSRVNSHDSLKMVGLLAIYEGLDVSMYRLDILLLMNLMIFLLKHVRHCCLFELATVKRKNRQNRR